MVASALPTAVEPPLPVAVPPDKDDQRRGKSRPSLRLPVANDWNRRTQRSKYDTKPPSVDKTDEQRSSSSSRLLGFQANDRKPSRTFVSWFRR
jgi:hypothetical protein